MGFYRALSVGLFLKHSGSLIFSSVIRFTINFVFSATMYF